MPKKAKKAKITGTPDVVKFKGTRAFSVLKGIISLQEQRILMSTDFLEEAEYGRISRLLHLFGLLVHDLLVEPAHPEPSEDTEGHPKDYRLHLHHNLVLPAPQLFPEGYSVSLVRQARAVIEKPSILVNRREYLYREDLKEASDEFLKNTDRRVIEMSSFIEVKLKSDFKDGLKLFKEELIKQLVEFDASWRSFERFFMQEKLRVNALIFEDVDKLVKTEERISDVEKALVAGHEAEEMAIKKSALEQEFTKLVGKLVSELVNSVSIPSEALTLAESCLFYTDRIPDHHSARPLVKAYMELRNIVCSDLRLHQELKTNDAFLRALINFKTAAEMAAPALECAKSLPRVAGIKKKHFITKFATLQSE